MRRVVVLGRGGAGKSVLAARLATLTGLPVVELDKYFWSPDLRPLPPREWARVQSRLADEPRWILDGDLGPYDVLDVRLRAADTVIVLDFALWRCVWRALRRSRENAAFWRWVIGYRRRGLPVVLAAVTEYAGQAEVVVARDPRELERWVRGATGPDFPRSTS
ncbi:adenylate kinase [Nocardia takedensis]